METFKKYYLIALAVGCVVLVSYFSGTINKAHKEEQKRQETQVELPVYLPPVIAKVTLIGTLGAEPEITTKHDGRRVATFPLKITEPWTNKGNGNLKPKEDWHRVAIVNQDLVETVEKRLNKGSRVYIEGAIRLNAWENQGVLINAGVIVDDKGELVLLESVAEVARIDTKENKP